MGLLEDWSTEKSSLAQGLRSWALGALTFCTLTRRSVTTMVTSWGFVRLRSSGALTPGEIGVAEPPSMANDPAETA